VSPIDILVISHKFMASPRANSEASLGAGIAIRGGEMHKVGRRARAPPFDGGRAAGTEAAIHAEHRAMEFSVR